MGHTPGPWIAKYVGFEKATLIGTADYVTAFARMEQFEGTPDNATQEANARLIAAAPELLEALIEARRAIGVHNAPSDCYATGPLTGDTFRDLVQCPACHSIPLIEAAIAKATGQ